MTKSIDEMLEKANEKEAKISRFCDLLDSLETTEDKKKYLWKEIYENALSDRENARILFTDLLIEAKGNAAQHAVFGPILSKYLERMCKSNDQILKLAEMIGKEDDKAVDVNSIFDKING